MRIPFGFFIVRFQHILQQPIIPDHELWIVNFSHAFFLFPRRISRDAIPTSAREITSMEPAHSMAMVIHPARSAISQVACIRPQPSRLAISEKACVSP